MKKCLPIFVIAVLISCFFFPFHAFAVTITDNQKTVISQYCSTIKQNLKTVQYFDIDNRIKLGSKYETLLSKYMVPLNIRIVKNNLSPASLADLQKSFADQKAYFATDFTTYSKLLEELIDTDCQNDPASFYERLIHTRDAREKVRRDTAMLNDILRRYKEAVLKIRGNYE